jgi:hypothetical protein
MTHAPLQQAHMMSVAQSGTLVAFDAADGQRERWRAVEAGGPRGSSILADVLPLQHRGSVGADLTFPRFDPGGVLRPTALRVRATAPNTAPRTGPAVRR